MKSSSRQNFSPVLNALDYSDYVEVLLHLKQNQKYHPLD